MENLARDAAQASGTKTEHVGSVRARIAAAGTTLIAKRQERTVGVGIGPIGDNTERLVIAGKKLTQKKRLKQSTAVALAP